MPIKKEKELKVTNLVLLCNGQRGNEFIVLSLVVQILY